MLAILAVAALSAASPAERPSAPTRCAAGQEWQPLVASPQGGVTFKGRLGATEVNILLDTGSQRSIVDTTALAALALKSGESQQVMTSGGPMTLQSVSPVPVSVGGRTATIRGAVASDLSTLSVPEARIMLVLGRDFLSSCRIDIDFDGSRLRLLPRDAPPPSQHAVPLVDAGPVATPTIPTRIGAMPAFRSMLDTGSAASLVLIDPQWRKYIPADQRLSSAPFGTGGGYVEATFAILGKVSVGLNEARDANAYLGAPSDKNGYGIPGQIGRAFLEHFNVQIDLTGHKLWLSGRRRQPPPPERSTSGLVVIPDGSILTVFFVMKNSPAERTGWKRGDRICSVDGDASSTPTGQAHTWTMGAAGRRVNLQLCDGTHRMLTLANFL